MPGFKVCGRENSTSQGEVNMGNFVSFLRINIGMSGNAVKAPL